MRLSWLWLGCVMTVLAGCTSVVIAPQSLPLSKSDYCAEAEGVSVRFNTLTIALGRKPTPGYEVEILATEPQKQQFQVAYQVLPPRVQPARKATTPCVQLILPNAWQSLKVIQYPSQQAWQFHPEALTQ